MALWQIYTQIWIILGKLVSTSWMCANYIALLEAKHNYVHTCVIDRYTVYVVIVRAS